MAKQKAKVDTIFKGQFYPKGQELPEDYAELSQGKTHRLGANFTKRTAEVAALRPAQSGRPGMSGSGNPQVADIVDVEGGVTQPGEQESEDAAKAASKAQGAGDKGKAGDKK